MLTDKDFIIKYDKLIMSRELKENDLDARELNVELPHAMLLKIMEAAVKNSIVSELVSVVSNQSSDGSPTPVPFNHWSLYGTTWFDEIGPQILGKPRLIPIPTPFPLELYNKGSLLHWLTGMNSGEFKANVTVSETMKKNIDKKERLTLNDEDFTIKYGKLILNKELTDADLNADSIDITFTPSMASKLIELRIKRSIQAEIVGYYVDEIPKYPWGDAPHALPERGTVQHWAIIFNDDRFQVNVSNLQK